MFLYPSCQFGFINWEEGTNPNIRNIIRRAIDLLRNILIVANGGDAATSEQQPQQQQQQQKLSTINMVAGIDNIDSSEAKDNTLMSDLQLLSNMKVENDVTITDASSTCNTATYSGDAMSVNAAFNNQPIEMKYEVKKEQMDDDITLLERNGEDERQQVSNNDTNTAEIEKTGSNGDAVTPMPIDPETYCKLGHLHLLMEEYYEGKYIAIACIYLTTFTELYYFRCF